MGDIFKIERAKESTGFLLWKVTNRWQQEIKKILKKYELSHTQFVVIVGIYWLSKENAEVTQIGLSKHVELDKMLISKVLRILEQRKLLKREEHKKDTRAKMIKLTREGEKIMKKSLKEVEAFDIEYFGRIKKLNFFNEELLNILEK